MHPALPYCPTRRQFVAAAVGALAASSARAYTGIPGTDGRFATAHIGLGQRGAWLTTQPGLDPRLLFDVDQRQLASRELSARAGATAAKTLREALEASSTDAVVIATPDHWHVPIAIAACRAGKDVYLESPCTWLPSEAPALLDAARHWGVVVQTGETLPFTRAGLGLKERLAALPPDAKLQVTCTAPANPTGGNITEPDVPEGLDWPQWLGATKERPFNPDLLNGNWRYTRDLGGGHIRSAGTNMLATLLWAAGVTPTSATVRANGMQVSEGLWDCPPDFSADITINSRIAIQWTQAEGAAYTMRIEGGGEVLQLDGLADEATLKAGDAVIAGPGWDGEVPTAHWATAMKQRSAPRLPLDIASAASTLTQLAIAAWRTRNEIAYDFSTHAITSNTAAQRLLAITYKGQLDAWL